MWGLSRVHYAASLYTQSNMIERNGYVVPCGNKSPGSANRASEPEAILAKIELMRMGVPADQIRPEKHSIDSATNLANVEAEGLLPADEPVAIVAHEKHLDRIMTLIALGIVVPKPDSYPKEPESFQARLATRAILLGISKDSPNSTKRITKRSELAWKITNSLLRVTDYHQA
jgi:hypothetical protein